MAHPQREEVREEQLTGFKYFDRLAALFERLHDKGCRRDKAGNRTLFMDQYCLLVLLYLFNPVVVSLRALQQASELAKVQKKLGCARASLGSLSESSHVFDPELLEEIIDELGQQLQPIAADARLADVRQTITLVDGTLVKALPRISEAMWLTTRTGTRHHAWRLHTQFELDKHVPLRMDLTNGRNSGPSDEKTVLRAAPRSGPLLRDGPLVCAVHAVQRHPPRWQQLRLPPARQQAPEVVEERTLSEEAVAAGVLSDQVVRLGQSKQPDARPDHPLRLVMVRMTPHAKRSHRKGRTGAGPSDGMLLIATNLLDVPAEIIALIYQHRWTIELFFRFFKHVLGCRHLLSHDPARHRDSDLLRDHRLHADQPRGPAASRRCGPTR